MKIEYMTIIVAAAFIVTDVITGIIQALMQKSFASEKMRMGIFHKVGFILCICFGILADWGQSVIDLGINIPITNAICAYVILTEIGSIIENISLINPSITPKWLRSMFSKLNGDEGELVAVAQGPKPKKAPPKIVTKGAAFAALIQTYLGNIYCWGGQGEKDTEKDFIKLIDRKETNRTNRKRAKAFYAKVKATGKSPILMFDCSGLIIYVLTVMGLFKGDTTANGIYTKHCTDILKSDLAAGDLVFRRGLSNGTVKVYHVGVYIGDGQVIHAKGRDCGVVQEAINHNGSSYWNRFGKLKVLA